MISLRKASDRFHSDHGWLDSWHTFSFADHYDPRHMGFSNLRVINDDRVAGGGGFPTHGHRDMEIVSYVLEGALGHKDSMGNGSTMVPGDVQRMSAGTGVRHSEMNASPSDAVHFLQIWILPAGQDLPPGYEQKRFTDDDKRGRLRLVASPDGADGSVKLNADAKIYAALVDGARLTHALGGRRAWVHVARGEARVNGHEMREGDGAAFSDEREVILEGEGGEVLVFDLP